MIMDINYHRGQAQRLQLHIPHLLSRIHLSHSLLVNHQFVPNRDGCFVCFKAHFTYLLLLDFMGSPLLKGEPCHRQQKTTMMKKIISLIIIPQSEIGTSGSSLITHHRRLKNRYWFRNPINFYSSLEEDFPQEEKDDRRPELGEY